MKKVYCFIREYGTDRHDFLGCYSRRAADRILAPQYAEKASRLARKNPGSYVLWGLRKIDLRGKTENYFFYSAPQVVSQARALKIADTLPPFFGLMYAISGSGGTFCMEIQ